MNVIIYTAKEDDPVEGLILKGAGYELPDIQKGWLAFDVLEERKEDEVKLMKLYSGKYGAKRFGETTMLIEPEKGEELIEKYLNH